MRGTYLERAGRFRREMAVIIAVRGTLEMGKTRGWRKTARRLMPAILAVPSLCLGQGVISTLAGNGLAAYSGDGGPGSSAGLAMPISVAVDGAGNLYVADRSTAENRVRKIDPSGRITTVAGQGTRGYSGDGGAATSAALSAPQGVTVDGAGNLYIADGGTRVRKVDTNGVITTVAGSGKNLFSGDGGPATSAGVSPNGVAVDSSGNLYISDGVNRRVRKVDANGVITTVAGNGNFGFSGDGGPATQAAISVNDVAVDSTGNLYFADVANHRVRKVDLNGVITTVAGVGAGRFSGDGGPATSAGLVQPQGLTIDGAGNLYIADWGDQRIRKVDTNGIIATVAGNGRPGFSGDGGRRPARCWPSRQMWR